MYIYIVIYMYTIYTITFIHQIVAASVCFPHGMFKNKNQGSGPGAAILSAVQVQLFKRWAACGVTQSLLEFELYAL